MKKLYEPIWKSLLVISLVLFLSFFYSQIIGNEKAMLICVILWFTESAVFYIFWYYISKKSISKDKRIIKNVKIRGQVIKKKIYSLLEELGYIYENKKINDWEYCKYYKIIKKQLYYVELITGDIIHSDCLKKAAEEYNDFIGNHNQEFRRINKISVIITKSQNKVVKEIVNYNYGINPIELRKVICYVENINSIIIPNADNIFKNQELENLEKKILIRSLNGHSNETN